MEDPGLFDLLECPLCLEPLEVTAKVLPCQHTFCKPCLQRQETSHPNLCCPECRAPVPVTVEELPANHLLVRLLEGLQQGPLSSPRDWSARHMNPLSEDSSVSKEDHQPSQHRHGQGTEGVSVDNSRSKVSGDFSVKPGDLINLRPRTDDSWYYSDANGSGGLGPVSMVQSGNQQPQQLPLCRALYNFDIKDLYPEDSKECLTFYKGDLITVIKPLDENWIEGKLRDRIGIFPLQFTEPNPVALKLLEKRKGSESAQSRPRFPRESGEKVNANVGGHRQHYRTLQSSDRPHNVSLLNRLNQPLPSQGQQPRHIRSSAPTASSKPASAAPAPKQRTDSSRRSLRKSERKMNGETPPTITMALISPQTPPGSNDNKQSSTQQLSISVCAALYSYKPCRSEELELRKGEMVGVYGKFKEGWLRGLSLRTGKVGILPANYVTPVLRTSARFLEQPKVAPVNTSTLSGKRAITQKPQAVVLALDKVNTEGTSSSAVPAVSMAPPHVMSSVRASQVGRNQGWDTIRRAFQPSYKGENRLIHRGSYYAPNPASNIQPPAQDLGQIYGFGRSPVLPRKRNGLFTNPIRPQNWTYEGTVPSSGGFQAVDRGNGHKETPVIPQSILVKPDSHRHHTEKPVKSVRFLTQDTPQTTPRMTLMSSEGQAMPSSSSGSSVLELWNPSAILGRDGSTSVLKDTKTLFHRKGLAQDHSTVDSLPFNAKTSPANNQSSPSRHRVAMGYSAQTDAELSLMEGEMVMVQRPRHDGRVLITQESSGKTGIFHNSIVEILDKVN
ncbi:E3 ubiquitin-protein ligase SH3RF2 [Chanos chanos]|uniref:E3 ubiquitin-protein ligase SH3RF2 n=1 Tax=Chanos chanos TaxID=29144 RepID=A0A6J2URU1_CHACN|nr:E3 ubiquitin-protein ligase SH3RF2-like [Chanos chanos]